MTKRVEIQKRLGESGHYLTRFNVLLHMESIFFTDQASPNIDSVLSRIHENGITTTLFYFDKISDLDENKLRNDFFPSEDRTEHVYFVLNKGNKSVLQLKYDIFGASKRNYPCTELGIIGQWTPNLGVTPGVSLFLQEQDIRDFRGKHLDVSSTADFLPSRRNLGHNGSLRPRYGIDAKLLNILAETLNFKYTIKSPLDQSWGIKLPNQSWSGLIGMIHRKEADIALGMLSITEERKEAVDFTMPYAYDAVVFVTKAPNAKGRLLSIIKPLRWQIWFAVFLSLVLATTFLIFINSITRRWRSSSSWHAIIWYLWGCLVSQGGRIPVPGFCSARVFLAAWWLLAVVFAASYGVFFIILNLHALQYSNDSVYGPLGGAVRKNRSILVKSEKEGILKTMDSKYAHIASWISMKFDVSKFGEHRFSFSKDHFSVNFLGIALQKGCPFKNSFDKVINRIVETGHMVKWVEDTRVERPENATDRLTEIEPHPLEVEDLLGTFYFLLLGHAIASLTLLAEYVQWNFFQ
ncbi:putative glutamate receptor [Tachypleus tridentatus]|uniref:putative glutamate receptor n=1 Tax=Tachypleus tridentatus TaxID=6853 RepID=UPI003FD47AE0